MSPGMHLMDRKVAAAGMNTCWREVKESTLEVSVLAVDWANQPGGGVKDPLADEPAPDAFVPGCKLDAFARRDRMVACERGRG